MPPSEKNYTDQEPVSDSNLEEEEAVSEMVNEEIPDEIMEGSGEPTSVERNPGPASAQKLVINDRVVGDPDTEIKEEEPEFEVPESVSIEPVPVKQQAPSKAEETAEMLRSVIQVWPISQLLSVCIFVLKIIDLPREQE